MPSLPNVAGVLKTVWHHTIGEDTGAENVIHIGYTGGPPSFSDAVALANDFMGAWSATGMKNNFSTEQLLTSVFVEDLSSSTGAVGSSTLAAIQGTDGTGVGSAASCVLVHEPIARRYRGGKPRIYFSGIQGTRLNDAQTWQSTFIASFQTNLNSFYTALGSFTEGTTATTGPVSVSYYQGYDPPTIVNDRAKNHPHLRTTPVVDPIRQFSAEIRVASQRRRLLRSP